MGSRQRGLGQCVLLGGCPIDDAELAQLRVRQLRAGWLRGRRQAPVVAVGADDLGEGVRVQPTVAPCSAGGCWRAVGLARVPGRRACVVADRRSGRRVVPCGDTDPRHGQSFQQPRRRPGLRDVRCRLRRSPSRHERPVPLVGDRQCRGGTGNDRQDARRRAGHARDRVGVCVVRSPRLAPPRRWCGHECCVDGGGGAGVVRLRRPDPEVISTLRRVQRHELGLPTRVRTKRRQSGGGHPGRIRWSWWPGCRRVPSWLSARRCAGNPTWGGRRQSH